METIAFVRAVEAAGRPHDVFLDGGLGAEADCFRGLIARPVGPRVAASAGDTRLVSTRGTIGVAAARSRSSSGDVYLTRMLLLAPSARMVGCGLRPPWLAAAICLDWSSSNHLPLSLAVVAPAHSAAALPLLAPVGGFCLLPMAGASYRKRFAGSVREIDRR